MRNQSITGLIVLALAEIVIAMTVLVQPEDAMVVGAAIAITAFMTGAGLQQILSDKPEQQPRQTRRTGQR